MTTLVVVTVLKTLVVATTLVVVTARKTLAVATTLVVVTLDVIDGFVVTISVDVTLDAAIRLTLAVALTLVAVLMLVVVVSQAVVPTRLNSYHLLYSKRPANWWAVFFCWMDKPVPGHVAEPFSPEEILAGAGHGYSKTIRSR